MHFTRGFRRNTNDAPLRTKLSAKKPPSLCVFLATHLNLKMTFCIYEEWFRPNPLSYRALCCPFFFWYQHSRRQMSTLKGAL